MNHRKRIAYGVVVIVLLSILMVPSGFAQEPTGTLAPMNPAFLQYLQDLKTAKVQMQTEGGYALGYIPSPHDFSHMTTRSALQASGPLVTYSSSYDLRALNRVTSVKNQNPCGACWAFATYGSLESSLKPGETWDFSEQNMKNTHGFDYSPCFGGNATMSTAYLARWGGPINESDDPYWPDETHPSLGGPVQKHVQEVLWLPVRASDSDNDAIKGAVMNYGAVYTSFYMIDGSPYYNNTTHAYYYNSSHGGNHAVAIVGWDDNYPASNFLITPPGNGAFITKNSWGTGWGESGYFYISYYDTKMGRAGEENAVFIEAEPTTNYSTIYQYDPLGWIYDYGYSNNTAWGANIFTASSNEALNAVGFYTTDWNTSYEIYIYKDVTAGVPRSGTLAGTKTGTAQYAGYHTVNLDSAISLASGQRFSVVIKFTTSGYTFPIPLEDRTGYTSGATASAGQSFVDSDGIGTWTDITSQYANANVCIKGLLEHQARHQEHPH